MRAKKGSKKERKEREREGKLLCEFCYRVVSFCVSVGLVLLVALVLSFSSFRLALMAALTAFTYISYFVFRSAGAHTQRGNATAC